MIYYAHKRNISNYESYNMKRNRLMTLTNTISTPINVGFLKQCISKTSSPSFVPGMAQIMMHSHK